MNREKHLIHTFPTKEGMTYIESLDRYMSKESDICPKCSLLLDKDGICWKCLTESNK